MTLGTDLLKRIQDGNVQTNPSQYIERLRKDVSAACEELLEVGARVRPLFTAGKRIGWMRGVHPAERRMLDRWGLDREEMIERIMLLGTSLSPDEVRGLGLVEMRSCASSPR